MSLRLSIPQYTMLVALATIFLACSTTLGRREYVEWIRNEKHGLHVLKKQGPYLFDVQFQPAEYMALQRIPADARLPENQWEEIKKSVSGLEYYTLKIDCQDASLDFINAGVSDMAEKQKKLYYYSYLFQEDISIVGVDSTRVPCALYHFEKTGNKGNSRTFVLAFESSPSTLEKSKVVIASPWLDNQPVEIEIIKKNIPALKL